MTDDLAAPVSSDAPSGSAADQDDPVVARLGAAIDPPSRASRAASWPGAALRRAGDWGIESWISLVIVAGCVIFVFTQLGPGNVLSSSTPAGGDMGAHVWAPAYLRDHLLPSFRLTGWTPDWYAGFPAFQFYMVLPSLAIALLSLVIPYGVAFKLVAVSGVLSLPVACWAFARLTRLPFPAPPLFAVAATAFLFDRSFSIYGGNIASTLAGEFAFSISLSFAVLFLGVVGRGLDTGRNRAWAAVLLALTGLCHLIPFIFAVAGAVVWLLVSLFRGPAPLAVLTRIADEEQGRPGGLSGVLAALAGAIVTAGRWLASWVRPGARRRIWWLVSAGVVGGALTAWWIVPFYLRSAYMNDMGWEKKTTYIDLLFRRENLDSQLSNTPPIEWVLVLALLGIVMSIAWKRRAGAFLVVMAIVAAIGFRYMPQGRLWNARLLPFWYLCLYLLAAVGVADLGRTLAALLARDPERPRRSITVATAVVGSLVAIIALAMPLRAMPDSIGIGPVKVDLGGTRADGSYHWLFLSTTDSSFVPSWARWNFTGYEGKPAYPEYHDIVQTMGELGESNGCGRAMWEHESQHDRYGTPMALMLLPFWTDGCIGSMEGLYFEASATTPYHFLNQDELSTAPSSAQRGLPYVAGAPTPEEFSLGIQHLQMLGVKYYMAISDGMIALGRSDPSLTEVASSGPWVVFEVADSSLVEPLDNQPAVLEGVSPHSWLEAVTPWYLDPAQWSVYPAAGGPADWQRITEGQTPTEVPTTPVAVTDIAEGTDSIEFDVSDVGQPVLVKASYFPNWKVDGAEGPWRIGPNMMVVVPTSTHVSLHYGYTAVDYLGWLITLAGLVGLVFLVRRGPLDIPPTPPWPSPRDPEGAQEDAIGEALPNDLREVARAPAGASATMFDPTALILGAPEPGDDQPDGTGQDSVGPGEERVDPDGA